MKRKNLRNSYSSKLKIVDFYQKANGLNECAKEFKTSVTIIRDVLKEFNIKVRTVLETKRLKRNNKINELQNEFINKANKIHNNFYNYSNTIYENSLTKIIINCPIHGDFLQTPASHINGQGCFKCGLVKQSKRLTSNTETFIKKSIKIHGNKYDYSKTNYTKSNETVLIICYNHGEFLQKANCHLSGNGCTKCGYEKNSNSFKSNTDKFIEKAKKIHGDLYDYSKSIYGSGNKKKLEIICKNHGSFWQRPNDHLSKNSKCPKCNLELNTRSKSGWIEKGKGKVGIFYIIKCYNENEKFYKIGITFNSVKKRYINNTTMPYKWEILREIKSNDLEYIWNLEVECKRKLRKYSYKPLISFGGATECFTNILNIDYIKSKEQLIKELSNKDKDKTLKELKDLEEFTKKWLKTNKYE